MEKLFQGRSYTLALLVAATAFAITLTVNGECNLCSTLTNLACISETEFQVCVDGTPTGAIASCAQGYVCSTVDASICQLNQPNVVVACADCNVCDQTGTFACTSTNTYALCLGGTTPSQLTGSCAPNHICNIEYLQICLNINQGIAPTCGTGGGGVTTTMTPFFDPLTYPIQYCRQLQQYGRFQVGRNISSTCKRYVFCFVRGGVWSGALYYCPGRTYFNSSSRLCEDALPLDCF